MDICNLHALVPDKYPAPACIGYPQPSEETYLGWTTWRRVCDQMDVDYDSLPDTVEDVARRLRGE